MQFLLSWDSVESQNAAVILTEVFGHSLTNVYDIIVLIFFSQKLFLKAGVIFKSSFGNRSKSLLICVRAERSVLVDDANKGLQFYSSMHQPPALQFLDVSEQMGAGGIPASIEPHLHMVKFPHHTAGPCPSCHHYHGRTKPRGAHLVLPPPTSTLAVFLTKRCCSTTSVTHQRCHWKQYVLIAGASQYHISVCVDPVSSNGPLSLYSELFGDSRNRICVLIKQMLSETIA